MLYNAFIRIGKHSWGIILSYMERDGKSYVPSAVEGCWLTCYNSSPCTGVSFCFTIRVYANTPGNLQDSARGSRSRDHREWWRENLYLEEANRVWE